MTAPAAPRPVGGPGLDLAHQMLTQYHVTRKRRDEAKAVLRHIASERDCLNDDVVDAILENLIG